MQLIFDGLLSDILLLVGETKCCNENGGHIKNYFSDAVSSDSRGPWDPSHIEVLNQN